MKYLKCFAFVFVAIFLFVLFFATLNYFQIISDSMTSYFYLFSLILTFFFGGVSLGKKCDTRGYLEGIKLGSFFILLFIICRFVIFRISFKIDFILYLVILLITSITGSIVGINKKEKSK